MNKKPSYETLENKVRQLEEEILSLKHAERALADSCDPCKTMLNSIQTGVVLIDAKTRVIVDVNPAAARLIGASEEEILGNICHRFICPAEVGRCPIIDLGHGIDKSERILINAEGEWVRIHKTVTPMSLGGRDYLIESFVDIMDCTGVEEALRQSEARANLILRTIPSALFTVDLHRRITSWNHVAGRIMGLKAEQVMGRECLQVFDCDECRKGCALFDEEIDKPIYGKECLLRVAGRKFQISKNADLLRDLDGRVIGGLESFIDISERKRAEKDQLEKERLQGVLEMAGAICHEFNQPLQNISGLSDLLLLNLKPDDPALKYAEAIKGQTRKMGNLTKSLFEIKDGYQTRPYLESRIVDLKAAPTKAEAG